MVFVFLEKVKSHCLGLAKTLIFQKKNQEVTFFSFFERSGRKHTEQTIFDFAVCCQSDPVARITKWVCYWADYSKCSQWIRYFKIPGCFVRFIGQFIKACFTIINWCYLQNFIVWNFLFPIPIISISSRCTSCDTS